MNPEKFYYSKWFTWFPFVNTFGFVLLEYYDHSGIFRPGYNYFSPWNCAFEVFIILFLINHSIWYLIPALRRQTILEIDDEKLKFRIKNKIIYWDDVSKVNYGPVLDVVIIKLKNSKTTKIYLNCVKGDNELVYRAVLGHFKQATSSEL